MKRSLAVTLSAVLSLLGSALTLLVGVLILVVFVFVTPPSKDFAGSPAAFKAVLGLASLIYILPAIWGILTSIGLFRLKNWARISMIVFSVILVLMSGCTLAVTALVPIPGARAVDQSTIATVRMGMGLFWLVLAAIGVWWLILFTRPSVKSQFVRPQVAIEQEQVGQMLPTAQSGQGAGNRPLSITIIAWLLLAGCLFIPITLLMHSPAILFTKIINWPAAMIYFLIVIGMHLYLGIGLLRLNPIARAVAIAYYVLLILNSSIFYFAPGAGARTQLLLNSTHVTMSWMEQPQPLPQFNMIRIMSLIGTIGLFFMLIPLYFLITRRQAFASKQ